MNRISILWFNSKKKDILLWDNNNVDILKNAFGNRSFTSLNTRKYLHIAPFYIFKAFVTYR